MRQLLFLLLRFVLMIVLLVGTFKETGVFTVVTVFCVYIYIELIRLAMIAVDNDCKKTAHVLRGLIELILFSLYARRTHYTAQ